MKKILKIIKDYNFSKPMTLKNFLLPISYKTGVILVWDNETLIGRLIPIVKNQKTESLDIKHSQPRYKIEFYSLPEEKSVLKFTGYALKKVFLPKAYKDDFLEHLKTAQKEKIEYFIHSSRQNDEIFPHLHSLKITLQQKKMFLRKTEDLDSSQNSLNYHIRYIFPKFGYKCFGKQKDNISIKTKYFESISITGEIITHPEKNCFETLESELQRSYPWEKIPYNPEIHTESFLYQEQRHILEKIRDRHDFYEKQTKNIPKCLGDLPEDIQKIISLYEEKRNSLHKILRMIGLVYNGNIECKSILKKDDSTPHQQNQTIFFKFSEKTRKQIQKFDLNPENIKIFDQEIIKNDPTPENKILEDTINSVLQKIDPHHLTALFTMKDPCGTDRDYSLFLPIDTILLEKTLTYQNMKNQSFHEKTQEKIKAKKMIKDLFPELP